MDGLACGAVPEVVACGTVPNEWGAVPEYDSENVIDELLDGCVYGAVPDEIEDEAVPECDGTEERVG